jgi:hypothetical protein
MLVEKHLLDVKAHVYIEPPEGQQQDGKLCPIYDSPIFEAIDLYMSGHPYEALKKYADYRDLILRTSNPNCTYRWENFMMLHRSIEMKGYRQHLIHVCKDNIIRDGQHRAAILYYLNGNIKVKMWQR